MRPARRAPRAAAKVSAPPSVGGRPGDLAATERAVSELSEVVNRIAGEESTTVEVDLVVGTNRIAHGLGQKPLAVLVTPRATSSAFAWAYDWRQLDNPIPDRVIDLEVKGSPMRARLRFIAGTRLAERTTELGTVTDVTGAALLADGDYGDVTVSGSGATLTIDNDTVTLAKLANMATDRLLGRDTAGSGDPEELTVGAGLEFTGAGGIGIANDGVTFARLQNLTSDRLIGRDTAGSGDAEEISVGGGLEFTGSTSIQRSALTGDVTAAAGSGATTIADDAVTNAKLAEMAALTVKANVTGSTANPTDVAISSFESFFGASGVYGDGSDGDATISGGTTTLTRDMFYDDLTIEGTGVLYAAGYRVFVQGTLTIDSGGVLHNNGNDATSSGTGANGGGVAAAGTLGAAGGSGGNSAANATPATPTGVTQALGGAGGAGGNGSGAGVGGSPGTVAAPVANAGMVRSLPFALFGAGIGFNTGATTGTAMVLAAFRGGSGGGGGNGNGLNGGGGGGGGGGVLVVAARVVDNDGTISVNGGDGYTENSGGGGGGWGGGGGGGGGLVILVTDSLTGNDPIADGGAGSAALGAGSDPGADGSPGTVIILHS